MPPNFTPKGISWQENPPNIMVILFTEKHYTIKDIFVSLGAAAAGATSGPGIFVGVLNAAGFQAAGIATGSYAATWMSWIGTVASGSLFATCQSVGAAGLGAFGSALAGGVVGGVAFGVAVGLMSLRQTNSNRGGDTFKDSLH
jgi:hypothetical protein